MRALVSGATGFSGRHLLERLRASGIDVQGVSHRVSGPSVERMDLTSRGAWESVIRSGRPDFIFHLSGVAHAATLSELVTHNTLAAAALLDGARASGHRPRALLLVGTAAEYGVVPELSLPVVEDFPASPRTGYGATKHAQTVLALEAATENLRVIVARPSNIIGPGMPISTALGSFARQLREIELGRQPPVLKVGNLNTSRDLVDVRDVADVYVALAQHDAAAGIVNVASGRQYQIRSVLEQLIGEFALQVSVETDPTRLRGVDVPRFTASQTRLTTLLGSREWVPLASSLRDMVDHERSING